MEMTTGLGRLPRAMLRSLRGLCSPYITAAGLSAWLGEDALEGPPWHKVKVMTHLQPQAVANGSLDVDALEDLLAEGAALRSCAALHAKLYFGEDWVLVGSANLTRGGVDANRESVLHCGSGDLLLQARRIFDQYWRQAEPVDAVSLRKCSAAAEGFGSLPVRSEELVQEWSRHYALVRVRIEVMGMMRQLTIDPGALGLAAEDAQRIRNSGRVVLDRIGESVVKKVRGHAKAGLEQLCACMISEASLGDVKVLPLVDLPAVEAGRKNLEVFLRGVLRREIHEKYYAIRKEVKAKAVEMVKAIHDGLSCPWSEALTSLENWFEVAFPRQDALQDDVRIALEFIGIHPIQLEMNPALEVRTIALLEAKRSYSVFHLGRAAWEPPG